MISVSAARAVLQGVVSALPPEAIPLQSALNLVLAKDVIADVDVPAFDNSAMDGYAFIAGSATSLRIVATTRAGDPPYRGLCANQAVRIFTGAPIPFDADTVVPQEAVRVVDGSLLFDTPAELGAHIRRKGSQSTRGSVVAPIGTAISPGVIGLLASVGISKVDVHRKPVASVIITGSELVDVGSALVNGNVYDSNGPMIVSFLSTLPAAVAVVNRVADDSAALQSVIGNCILKSDVTIIVGGISVGDYDFVRPVLTNLGVRELFYKIRQKPGKPLYAGVKENSIVLALPGNPAAAASCFRIYGAPVVRSLAGHASAFAPDAVLPLSAGHVKKPELTHFVKGQVSLCGATILGGQESFDLSSFTRSNALLELKEGQSVLNAGDLVDVFHWV